MPISSASPGGLAKRNPPPFYSTGQALVDYAFG